MSLLSSTTLHTFLSIGTQYVVSRFYRVIAMSLKMGIIVLLRTVSKLIAVVLYSLLSDVAITIANRFRSVEMGN